MRMKIIKRFSAATVGVCFTYALIRLPFSMINSESQTMSEDNCSSVDSGYYKVRYYRADDGSDRTRDHRSRNGSYHRAVRDRGDHHK